MRSTGILPVGTSWSGSAEARRRRLWRRGLDCEVFGPSSSNVTEMSERYIKVGQPLKSVVGAPSMLNNVVERRDGDDNGILRK